MSALPRSAWAHRIPHAGAMCLLDEVLAWDADTIHASALSHHDDANPLRRDGRLHALHLAEYGAQAGAVHAALVAAEGSPRDGMLVALRDVRLACEFIDQLDGPLQVHAECLAADANGASYAFHIGHGDDELVSGRCTVMYGEPSP